MRLAKKDVSSDNKIVLSLMKNNAFLAEREYRRDNNRSTRTNRSILSFI